MHLYEAQYLDRTPASELPCAEIFTPSSVAYDTRKKKVTFVSLVIGVIKEKSIHRGGRGEDISYKSLMAILCSLGFDPLFPLRNLQLRLKITNELTKIVLKGNNVKASSNKLGANIVSLIKDYIISGEKPSLAKSTIQSRISFADGNKRKGLYKYGVENALYETGLLCEAIEYKLITKEVTLKTAIQKSEENKRNAKKEILKARKENYKELLAEAKIAKKQVIKKINRTLSTLNLLKYNATRRIEKFQKKIDDEYYKVIKHYEYTGKKKQSSYWKYKKKVFFTDPRIIWFDTLKKAKKDLDSFALQEEKLKKKSKALAAPIKRERFRTTTSKPKNVTQYYFNDTKEEKRTQPKPITPKPITPKPITQTPHSPELTATKKIIDDEMSDFLDVLDAFEAKNNDIDDSYVDDFDQKLKELLEDNDGYDDEKYTGTSSGDIFMDSLSSSVTKETKEIKKTLSENKKAIKEIAKNNKTIKGKLATKLASKVKPIKDKALKQHKDILLNSNAAVQKALSDKTKQTFSVADIEGAETRYKEWKHLIDLTAKRISNDVTTRGRKPTAQDIKNTYFKETGSKLSKEDIDTYKAAEKILNARGALTKSGKLRDKDKWDIK